MAHITKLFTEAHIGYEAAAHPERYSKAKSTHVHTQHSKSSDGGADGSKMHPPEVDPKSQSHTHTVLRSGSRSRSRSGSFVGPELEAAVAATVAASAAGSAAGSFSAGSFSAGGTRHYSQYGNDHPPARLEEVLHKLHSHDSHDGGKGRKVKARPDNETVVRIDSRINRSRSRSGSFSEDLRTNKKHKSSSVVPGDTDDDVIAMVNGESRGPQVQKPLSMREGHGAHHRSSFLIHERRVDKAIIYGCVVGAGVVIMVIVVLFVL